MAYGNKKGTKNTMRRSVDIARLPVHANSPLARLREDFVALCDLMAAETYPKTLSDTVDWDAIEKRMLEIQKASPLNTMYKQEARMCVKSVLSEQVKRRFRNLYGRMLNVASRPDKGGENAPTFINVDEDFTRELDEAEIVKIAKKWTDMSENEEFYAHLLTLLALREEDGKGCAEVRLMTHLARKAEEKFSCPTWTGPEKDRKAVRISIYPFTIRSKEGMSQRDVLSAFNDRFATGPGDALRLNIALTSPLPKGRSIKLKLRMTRAQHQRIVDLSDGEPIEAHGLCLEIRPKFAVIRLITAKEPGEKTLMVRYVIPDDFGLRNSCAISVIDLGKEYPLKQAVKRVKSVTTKEEAKAYLEAHTAPEFEVIDQALFPADGFRAAMARIAAKIDGTTSSIDKAYNKLRARKAQLNGLLGRAPDEPIPEDLSALGDAFGERECYLHEQIFRILKQIAGMKGRRRSLYDQAAGVKKSWLGHLSGVQVRLARRYGAVIIREDLTFLTTEKGTPEYKGRTMNKLINNASRGQFARRVEEKAAYAGVPVLLVPSFYTSSYDYEEGVVDKKRRKGDTFTMVSGKKTHADLHASITIGLWAFLVKKDTNVRKSLVNPPHGRCGGQKPLSIH